MGEDKLWHKLVKMKYLGATILFDYETKTRVSYYWRSIISTRDLVTNFNCYNLGDNLFIRPWKDPWIPWLEGKTPILKQGLDINDGKKIEDLKLASNDGDVALLESLCEPESCEAIK